MRGWSVSRMFVAVGVVGLVVGAVNAHASPPVHHHRTTTKKVAAHERGAPASLVVPVQAESPPPAPGVTLAEGAVLISHRARESRSRRTARLHRRRWRRDFSAGITDDLTLSVVTSASGMPGFAARPATGSASPASSTASAASRSRAVASKGSTRCRAARLPSRRMPDSWRPRCRRCTPISSSGSRRSSRSRRPPSSSRRACGSP